MIEVKNLTKRYGDKLAVDSLSTTIDSGHIYGFLGPNGAGKTTTMNIITGCLAATEGSVSIGGHDIFEEPLEAKKLLGYLPEQPPLYLDMTAEEYLCFVARAKGLRGKNAKDAIIKAMERTQITEVSGRIIKQLSKGYRQRVGIAQAILAEPEVVILDEPTVGLDPVQVVEIRQLIRRLGRRHTVIFSSHILSEVSEICDRILIISNGRLVAEGTPDELSGMLSGSRTLEITVKGETETIKNALTGIKGINEFVCSSNEDGRVNVEIFCATGTDPREDVSIALGSAGCAIIAMGERGASLEDVFMELVSENRDETKAGNEEEENSAEQKGGGGDGSDIQA